MRAQWDRVPEHEKKITRLTTDIIMQYIQNQLDADQPIDEKVIHDTIGGGFCLVTESWRRAQ